MPVVIIHPLLSHDKPPSLPFFPFPLSPLVRHDEICHAQTFCRRRIGYPASTSQKSVCLAKRHKGTSVGRWSAVLESNWRIEMALSARYLIVPTYGR